MTDVFPVLGRSFYRDTMGDPRRGHRHRGTDIGADEGTQVVLMRSGTVVATLRDESRPCGIGLVVDDDDGVRWTYCHLSFVERFPNRSRIEAGTNIGLVGNTGNASSGSPHLHLQAIAERGQGAPVPLVPMLDAARSGASSADEHEPVTRRDSTWLVLLAAAGAAWFLSGRGR
jgi:peptidoglycan LD-endopeptidase LytH